MAFTKELPQWENAGQKPPQSKISEGFKPLDHPPADWFNWYMNGTYEALKELQDGAASSEEVTAALKVLSDALSTHSNAKNNPHSVTKSQIGLGNVDNIKQASKADFDTHVGDSKIHVTEAEKDKWNNGQLFRLTQNNGKPIYKGTSETTDYNEITDTGFYLIFNRGLNGPPSTNASFMIVISYTSTLLQTTYSTDGKKSYYRIRKTDSTWSEWTRVLTEEDMIPQSERDKWNNGQLSKITADNGMPLISLKDTSMSILDSVINNGLGQGTFYAIAGSKDLPNNRSFRGFFHMTDSTNGKASFGWVYATDYLNNIYTNYLNNSIWSGWKRLLTDQDAITEAEKDKWNNGQLYKMTQDSGTRKLIPEGSDLLTLPPGFYFGINNRLLNNPDPSDTGWFNYDVSESGSGRKMIIAVASYKNTMWFGTVHTNGDFKGWKKVLTAEDVANSTFVDTYDHDNSSVSAAENVATKLVFGATRADDLSEYNRSRAEITLKNSGLYLIRLYVTSTNITVGSDNVLACYVNGSEYQRFGNWYPATSSSTCVLYLSQKFKAGDKVTFYITPRGTNKTVSINTAYVTMSQLR